MWIHCSIYVVRWAFINWNSKGCYGEASLYVLKTMYQFVKQSSPCAFFHVDGTVDHVRVVSSNLFCQRTSLAYFLLWWKWCQCLVSRRDPSLPPFSCSAEFPNSSMLPAYTAAAATVCHQFSQSSIIYFQTVCKALQHSLLCPYTGKRRERTSERPGEQKQRSLWNPLLGKLSYLVIAKEERKGK